MEVESVARREEQGSEALLKLEGRVAEGKAEVRTLREAAERGWSSAVREESVRRREATDKLSTRLKEEIDKLASNGRLDMNLERARAKEELRVSQAELLAEAKRIEGMLLNHQQEILKMKNDLFKVRCRIAFLGVIAKLAGDLIFALFCEEV